MTVKPPLRTFRHIEEALEEAVKDTEFDYEFRITGGREYAWSCEIRLTPEPNQHGRPDRSFVTYACGASEPEDAAIEAVEDTIAWLKERQAKPIALEAQRSPAPKKRALYEDTLPQSPTQPLVS